MIRRAAWDLWGDEMSTLTVALVVIGTVALAAAKWIGAPRKCTR